jgi:protocatechuate 3,4-dioxygenase beta subunit
MTMGISQVPRRALLKGLAAACIVGLLTRLSNLALARAPLAVTPECEDGEELTPSQTEGPYFTPNSPQRTVLRESDMPGTPILLTGFVLSRSCVPLAGVLVELWHADDAGVYDNEGYRLRGHQFTGADGSYHFATIVPGLYPGRTRHFHAKFQAPDQPILTTQFYFPNEADNSQDRIFNPDLLLKIAVGPERIARFDVVLAIA